MLTCCHALVQAQQFTAGPVHRQQWQRSAACSSLAATLLAPPFWTLLPRSGSSLATTSSSTPCAGSIQRSLLHRRQCIGGGLRTSCETCLPLWAWGHSRGSGPTASFCGQCRSPAAADSRATLRTAADEQHSRHSATHAEMCSDKFATHVVLTLHRTQAELHPSSMH